MSSKKRSPHQTATAFSLERSLFERLEEARLKLGLSRSDFIRMCVSKEIGRLDKSHYDSDLPRDGKGGTK